MTAEAILLPIINAELEKYRQNGKKIKLKTIEKRTVTYTIIFGILALCGFAHPIYFAAIPIYIILMMRNRKPELVILSLAKKYPNKPVDQIIAEEIK